jgi:membrane-bound lytic murein transglycosylase D
MRCPVAAPFVIRIVFRAAVCLGLVLTLGSGIAPAHAREPVLAFSASLPVSPAMEERIRFWIDVFARVPHHEAVLHDRDDLRIVYAVVPYGPDGDTTHIEATRASYARLLGVLATETGLPMLSPPSLERQHVRALFGVRAGPIAYARAMGNIRAQRGMKHAFSDGLVRAELYLPKIRRIFRDAKLPPELAYLPHVESSFNPSAVSRAGAVGLWQFTRATFDHYVEEPGKTDGRLDPMQSTEVAARHLTRARDVLGSWPLAIASYNHGVAGMVRARNAVGGESLDDIVRGYEGSSFGFASQNFYAEVLAAAHVAIHARFYFPDLPQPPILEYVVRPGDSLWTIARRHRVSVKDITVANNLAGSRLKTGQTIVIKSS